MYHGPPALEVPSLLKAVRMPKQGLFRRAMHSSPRMGPLRTRNQSVLAHAGCSCAGRSNRFSTSMANGLPSISMREVLRSTEAAPGSRRTPVARRRRARGSRPARAAVHKLKQPGKQSSKKSKGARSRAAPPASRRGRPDWAALALDKALGADMADTSRAFIPPLDRGPGPATQGIGCARRRLTAPSRPRTTRA